MTTKRTVEYCTKADAQGRRHYVVITEEDSAFGFRIDQPLPSWLKSSVVHDDQGNPVAFRRVQRFFGVPR